MDLPDDDQDEGPPGASPPYKRRDWSHGQWADLDGNCRNTRDEVLLAESLIPVVFTDAHQCHVKSGVWICPYTGRTFTDPKQLDIDHLVPVEEAHVSGGWAWPSDKKREYYNNLQDPDALIAVSASANRAKGAKDPHDWLPENAADHCSYVRAWLKIKASWGLSIDPEERQTIESVLARCPSAQ